MINRLVMPQSMKGAAQVTDNGLLVTATLPQLLAAWREYRSLDNLPPPRISSIEGFLDWLSDDSITKESYP